MNKVLDNEFWVPFSRLSYGAFLVHGVFMLFREYNNERGQWGELFDATLFFLAYAFLSFLFSTLLVRLGERKRPAEAAKMEGGSDDLIESEGDADWALASSSWR